MLIGGVELDEDKVSDLYKLLDVLRDDTHGTVVWQNATVDVVACIACLRSGVSGSRKALIIADHDVCMATAQRLGAIKAHDISTQAVMVASNAYEQVPSADLCILLAHPIYGVTQPTPHLTKIMDGARMVVIWPDCPSADQSTAFLANSLGRGSIHLVGTHCECWVSLLAHSACAEDSRFSTIVRVAESAHNYDRLRLESESRRILNPATVPLAKRDFYYATSNKLDLELSLLLEPHVVVAVEEVLGFLRKSRHASSHHEAVGIRALSGYGPFSTKLKKALVPCSLDPHSLAVVCRRLIGAGVTTVRRFVFFSP